jgi:hypothetical protein
LGFDRVNLYFKNNLKRCLFNKKTKVNRLQPGFAWSTRRVGRVMIFSIFSSTRPGSSPEPAGFRVDPPGWAGFQNYS